MQAIAMTDTTDAAMMVRLQAGDRQAFEELWGRWRHPIFQFLLRRTGARQHAEDAFQRTWLKVYKYRQSYDPTRPFRSWVFRIAANAGTDARRADGDLFYLPPEALDDMRWATTTDSHEVRDLAAKALHALNAQDRRILLLTIEGFTSPEIAELLEMNQATVRVRLHRARHTIRAALGGPHD
jgi:RNA polymerase sigma factor (sigma-70 family)